MSFPDYPWQKFVADLFMLKNINFLIIVHYYSRYMEMSKLSSTTSSSVIQHIKSIFAKCGITETFVADNGPQFSSSTFIWLAREYGFHLQTSNLNYLQSNSEAECIVKTIKAIINKCLPRIAILSSNSTCQWLFSSRTTHGKKALVYYAYDLIKVQAVLATAF